MRFRQFIEQGAEAAPAMGTGPTAPNTSPDDPDDGTHYDSDVANREFDISPEEADKISLEGEMITCFRPPTNIPQQQFIASAPIFLQVVKNYPDGSKDVKVMFSLCNRQKLKHLDGVHQYHGPVEDIDAHVTKGELDQIKYGAFKSGGGAPGMGMPAGGMGAPPGVGAPPGGMS